MRVISFALRYLVSYFLRCMIACFKLAFIITWRQLLPVKITLIQDERLLEYDIDKLVFEARSPYQKVQIVHSKSLGNLLVLDELQSKRRCVIILSTIYNLLEILL